MRNFSEETRNWSLSMARDYLEPALQSLEGRDVQLFVNFPKDVLEMRDRSGRKETLFTHDEIRDGSFKGKLMDRVMKFTGEAK